MSKDIKEVEKEVIAHIGGFISDVKTTAKLINKSETTLWRWRENSLYLSYRKIGNAKNSVIEYTAYEIARYLTENNIEVYR